MENTGRIRKLLVPKLRRLIFAPLDERHGLDELMHITRVDQAHLIMLAECNVVPGERVARVLNAIHRLRASHFASLRGQESERGIFLLYEDFLIAAEDSSTGGVLQTARSRNDLNATVLKLRLRGPYLAMLEHLLRLIGMLLQKARKYSHVIMPLYTHGQAAMPGSYGHYLLGIAGALLRDCSSLLQSGIDLQISPLGAGALAGTSFPIQPLRTAELLGFEHGPLNSVDAVASRDWVLRLISSAAICAITLSRLATDFSQWTTAEFDFLQLPDELVGSSSAMPQKRNPFLLEHVQGRSAALTGAFVHSAAAMHATPFTNSIAVGTEAVKPAAEALQNLGEMTIIMKFMVAGAQPNQDAMLQRAIAGFTTATELANMLVRECNLDFRSAHHAVGEMVAAACAHENCSLEEAAAAYFKDHGFNGPPALHPRLVVSMLRWGGGPGPDSFTACLEHLQGLWRDQREQKSLYGRKWKEAEIALQGEVKRYSGVEQESFSSCS